MKRLFYFAPTFHPKNTGFAIAFLNIIKAISKKGFFDEIIIFTTDDGVSIPDELSGTCRIEGYKFKGRERLARLPKPLCLGLLPLACRSFLSKVSAFNICENDVFFYEEFGMGFEKFSLEEKYPANKHFIRVHGTFPEFTKSFQGLSHRKRYVDLAVNAKQNNIVSTTNFYFKYLNDNFFGGSYDIQQKINFYILPNLILDVVEHINDDNDSSKVTLIQLGRMDELGVFQKGFFDTVRALRYIESVAPNLAKKLQFILIGDGGHVDKVDDELKKLTLIDIVRRKKCSNDEVKEFIGKSQVVLLPSRCEGMSMFATESLFLGKPIVFTEDNGLQDYLVNDFNGISITSFDYTELAKAIIRYVESPNLVKEHSSNCKKTAADILLKTDACLDVLFG